MPLHGPECLALRLFLWPPLGLGSELRPMLCMLWCLRARKMPGHEVRYQQELRKIPRPEIKDQEGLRRYLGLSRGIRMVWGEIPGPEVSGQEDLGERCLGLRTEPQQGYLPFSQNSVHSCPPWQEEPSGHLFTHSFLIPLNWEASNPRNLPIVAQRE